MRYLLAAAALVAMAGVASAEDARWVPAAGTSLTFRLLSTVKRADSAVTTGQVYTYVVKSSDGTIAEGTIHPDALIFGCAASDSRAECVNMRKMANAKQEGNLLTVPIPRDLGDRLATQNAFKSRYFMPELRRMAQPLPRTDNPGDNAEFDSEPGFVVTNSFVCPPDEFQKFIPLGSSKSAVFHCQVTVALVPRVAGHPPANEKTNAMTFAATYEGKSRVVVPGGEWDVENFSYKTVQTDSSGPNIETEMAFSPKLGMGVKARSRYSAGGNAPSVDATTELIAVSP